MCLLSAPSRHSLSRVFSSRCSGPFGTTCINGQTGRLLSTPARRCEFRPLLPLISVGSRCAKIRLKAKKPTVRPRFLRRESSNW